MQHLEVKVVPAGTVVDDPYPDDMWAFPPGQEFVQIERAIIQEGATKPGGLPVVQFVMKLSTGKYVTGLVTAAILHGLVAACEGVAQKTGKTLNY